ncbi:PorP/SprF family type IX secretion system membrane protein [Croceibacter atlanticus]|uniref:PorP/SprF family type IX secretion system membrane protein n=1 Tax=Croceibacter atlanticus TaxID=313588 RepID=UPI002355C45D|nr:type IX secretion system membrane protein PorP/SprF [Croceibacter atlanticus]|tara:strand:- start:2244 stop:3176 length:933 start_codon:yes stop_codon:yes gene_type:complete
MKKLLVISSFVLLFASQFATAQQDPQYTQYMYNMSVVNPAYAGIKENLNVGVLYRDQWSGFRGAPKTFTFFAHSPVGEKTGLGLSAIADENGPVKETNVYADFSYRLDLGATTKLAFGVKAGATFHDVGLIDVGNNSQDNNDQAFSQNSNETFANFGAGFLLYGDNWYVGASIPNFLNATHLEINENGNDLELGNEVEHLFATAGYVFQVSENLKFKPSAIVKTAFDAPVSFDVNANFLMYDRLEIGASYRLEDAVSGLINIRATDWVQLGFAYDYVLSDIGDYAPSSFEAMVIFDVFFNKKTFRSPRYF